MCKICVRNEKPFLHEMFTHILHIPHRGGKKASVINESNDINGIYLTSERSNPLTKYEIQHRYFKALARPGAVDVEKIHDEIDEELREEIRAAAQTLYRTFNPLLDFNNAQLDETKLVLDAYDNPNRAMHNFALKYVKAASAAVIIAEEESDAET